MNSPSRNGGETSAATPESAALKRLRMELADEHRLHSSNRRRALRRRVKAARKFPTNTCPASRHVAIIADMLSTYGEDWMLIEEPLHCAGSLYATVAALWEARTELAALRGSGPTSVTPQVAQPIREDLESKGEA